MNTALGMTFNYDFIREQFGLDLQPDQKGMINVSSMAKPFNKKPEVWLISKYAKCYVALVRSRGVIDPIETRDNEIWMYTDIAIEYAKELSVPFRVYTHDFIRKVFTFDELWKKFNELK